MKQSIVTRIFIHPIMQILSFCAIVINGQVFATPYAWMIRYAFADGEWFAFAGAAAILVTTIGVFVWRRLLQGTGLFLMWVSITLFLCQATNELRSHLLEGPIAAVTHLIFVVVTILVVINYFKWKNF